MVQFNLYVHGVPIGHEICPRDAEEDYLKVFYSHDKEIKETSFMQIDIVNGKSFYTYLHKKNVSSEIGRPGSYLGLTVCFTKQYCTNVHMLYEILDTIYKKICVGCLVRQEEANERFLVKEIASAQFKGNLAVDYIKAAFKQNMEKYLLYSFEDINGFSNPIGEVKFSLKEVDSPLFYDTLKNNRILVSSEYGTVSVAYNNLLKEIDPLREEYGRFKQDNSQLRERNKSLSDEVVRLEKELSKAEASASKKYKKQLEEAWAKCDNTEREKKRLEDKIKEVTSAVGQMDLPLKTLTRLMASRFPEGYNTGSNLVDESHSSSRAKNSVKSWLPMVNLILLLSLLALSGYCCYALSGLHEPVAIEQEVEQDKNVDNSVNIEDETYEDEFVSGNDSKTYGTARSATNSYDDFSDCQINISHYNGIGNLKKGKTYSLYVKKNDNKKANVPDGTWSSTEGVTINGNTFTVNDDVSQPTNVLLHYTVDNKKVLTRAITVE